MFGHDAAETAAIAGRQLPAQSQHHGTAEIDAREGHAIVVSTDDAEEAVAKGPEVLGYGVGRLVAPNGRRSARSSRTCTGMSRVLGLLSDSSYRLFRIARRRSARCHVW